jgi:hypothetical protein
MGNVSREQVLMNESNQSKKCSRSSNFSAKRRVENRRLMTDEFRVIATVRINLRICHVFPPLYLATCSNDAV